MAEITQTPLEQEIAQIEKTLAEKRSVLEQQAGIAPDQMPHPKETLREVLREGAAPGAATQGQVQLPQPIPVQPPPRSGGVNIPSYLMPELKDKVQEYVNLAFTESIFKAIKEVRATNNAALIDAVHDAITDELWVQLKERGKLNDVQ
ncbi:MAG: hypothetical protein CEN90_574 [Parcubacteria group bacterium Licking1014_17]|nr:MAG: hypothetical protein CEN90_574 [Parcubacteria group bacterium Licking1014_17]